MDVLNSHCSEEILKFLLQSEQISKALRYFRAYRPSISWELHWRNSSICFSYDWHLPFQSTSFYWSQLFNGASNCDKASHTTDGWQTSVVTDPGAPGLISEPENDLVLLEDIQPIPGRRLTLRIVEESYKSKGAHIFTFQKSIDRISAFRKNLLKCTWPPEVSSSSANRRQRNVTSSNSSGNEEVL